MELLVGIIVGLVILIFLVAVHEFGHAFAAVKNGVGVDEFGIGFPPRAWAKKLKNGTLFTLNWLPLGGFVRLQGEYDSAKNKGDYGAASFWQKTQILLAGVLVNWIVAALILTVLAWVGLPKVLPNQFFVQSDTTVISEPVEAVHITSDSPAEKAGLQVGDRILSVDGQNISSPEQLAEQTKQRAGEKVAIVFERAGNRQTVDAQLNAPDNAQGGYLGVAPGQREFIKAGWSAPVTGVVTTAQFSWLTLTGVKDLAVNTVKGVVQRVSPNADTREQAKEELGKAAESVAGPIGILGVIFPAAAQAGGVNLLFLTAIISLTLAVMNILPIPALDGGRWATMAVFRLLKKPLTKEREETIQGTGFMILLGLIIVITLTDIGKLL
jgi:regulator of sigma E protease